MRRFNFQLPRTVLAALVLLGIFAPAGATAGERRPNLLFVFGDDYPQSCVGCLGNRHVQTPNLDRLAAEGVLFTNSFVTTAICCSNRACILTGQHMRRHGIGDFAEPLSAEAFGQTYPALLRAAGYRTGFLGKFAVGGPEVDKELALPAGQFDFWLGFPQSINFRQQVDGKVKYLTTLMEEQAVEFLKTNPRDQPFCLTVALKEPHGPWNLFDPDVADPYAKAQIPPPATFTREDFRSQPEFLRDSLNGQPGERWFDDPEAYQQHLRSYYRLVTRADLALGRLMEALKAEGFDENTVVIFSSDNGSMLGAHGLEGKWIMYEESIRVPLVIRDPRLSAARRGRRCDKMVLSIDLAPTMLALAGVATAGSMQGRDLTPLLRDEPVDWRSDWYYEHVYSTRPPRRPIVKVEGVRTERWKYTRYPEIEPLVEQLFDLEADPLERVNVAGEAANRQTLAELRSRCDHYRNELQ
ncbi:MAG: sulfatase family protein [Thermoguttaceae bacterium]